jgi:hypothetical protein
VRLEELDPEKAEKEIPRILTSEINPKLIDYRNEMASARDGLFGDLIKKVVAWEVPTVSLACLAGCGFATALAAFAAALTPAIPAVVDYYSARRDHARRNSMSYLIGITKGDEG